MVTRFYCKWVVSAYGSYFRRPKLFAHAPRLYHYATPLGSRARILVRHTLEIWEEAGTHTLGHLFADGTLMSFQEGVVSYL